MTKRWYHIYVDDEFMQTVSSTQEMWVILRQAQEIYSDYKNSVEVIMSGMGESVVTFRSKYDCGNGIDEV
jgi:hypothetical protein